MNSEWYCRIAAQIEDLKLKLLPRDVKEYQLEKLQCIARRVGEFSPGDPVCRKYQGEIEAMVAELAGAPLPAARNKAQMWKIGEMISHLKKCHKLVNDGEYLGWCLIIGLLIGGFAGLIIGETPPATGLGLALGAIIGVILDARAKREGRVI